MRKQKPHSTTSSLDREEYGYGYDRSVDDLGVIGENRKQHAGQKKQRDEKEKR